MTSKLGTAVEVVLYTKQRALLL